MSTLNLNTTYKTNPEYDANCTERFTVHAKVEGEYELNIEGSNELGYISDYWVERNELIVA